MTHDGVTMRESLAENDNLTPEEARAVDHITERFLKQYPVTPAAFGRMFLVDPLWVSPTERKYFQAYAALATRQLAIADLKSAVRAKGRRDMSPEELAEDMACPWFGGGLESKDLEGIYWHDLSHTIIEAGKHPDSSELHIIRPRFFKEDAGDGTLDSAVAAELQQDEDTAVLWDSVSKNGRRARQDLLQELKTRGRDGFVHERGADFKKGIPASAYNARIRSRIFDEFQKDRKLFFRMFVEMTLPIMREHAPKEYNALRKSYGAKFPDTVAT